MIIIAGAAVGALIVGAGLGALIGFKVADTRLKRLYEDVRVEVAHLRTVAQDKLSADEPNLDTLLRNLNDAVQDTFAAAGALEHHEKVVTQQREGGREVITSSRQIIRMIDQLAGNEPEPLEPAPMELAPAEQPEIAEELTAPAEKRLPPVAE